MNAADATSRGDVVMILLPDERQGAAEHQVEKVGAELRSMMPWIEGDWR